MSNHSQSLSRSGAACVVEALWKAGVKVIFGYPGGMVLPIFDALRDSKIDFVLARHEQGAVHMADGYARSSGKTGCCLVTSGPGATNTVTGLATACMDGIPLVCVCGQVPISMIGNDAFQEADTIGITRSVTKHNFLVRCADEIPQIVAEAFFIATSGRHGPVLIDMPRDVQLAETAERPLSPDDVRFRSLSHIPLPRQEDMCAIAETIARAERPVIYAGSGFIVSNSTSRLLEVAQKASIPVTTTLMGIGAFPTDHPLHLGMVGMHGSVAANMAVARADLLICAGARFDDRVTGKISEFAPRAKVVHINVDRSELGKSVRPDIAIHGSVDKVFAALAILVRPAPDAAWLVELAQLQRDYPFSYNDNGRDLFPQYALECLDRLCAGNDIIVTDVGQNQMWAAQYMTRLKPRGFITSGGLGTMGFGLPAAIGAQLANRDRRVVCIAGDGGIQMNFQELVVAVENKLPVKIVVLNNGYLGLVRQSQELFYSKRYFASSLSASSDGTYLPDFVQLAKAHGACAVRVTDRRDVMSALSQAFADDNTWLVEFRVKPDENVLPMIPPGQSIAQMIK